MFSSRLKGEPLESGWLAFAAERTVLGIFPGEGLFDFNQPPECPVARFAKAAGVLDSPGRAVGVYALGLARGGGFMLGFHVDRFPIVVRRALR